MFYCFNQNNSFGKFDDNDDVCGFVIIEAQDAEAANLKAELIGIYFDGCDKGWDCNCCGDRWYRASESDGTERPEIYGTPVEEAEIRFFRTRAYVYYADGSKKEFVFDA